MLRWHMPGTGPIRDWVVAQPAGTVLLHCIFPMSRSVITLLCADHRLAGVGPFTQRLPFRMPLQNTCSDSLLNGDETDTDCGGSCSPCGGGKKCASGSDCASTICDASVCKVRAGMHAVCGFRNAS